MKPTLILGYGNADRQDDGVAWHILVAVANGLGWEEPSSPEESFLEPDRNPNLLFALQLTPELAETIARYERVCFVDAHTGNVPNDVHKVDVQSEFQASPFTHHMTPATCLAICNALFGKKPQAILVSVRGYEFGFSRALSRRTSELVEQAAKIIHQWLIE